MPKSHSDIAPEPPYFPKIFTGIFGENQTWFLSWLTVPRTKAL
jgi:hypothetical protein